MIITKDLIAQHNLTDDKYKKIVEIVSRQQHRKSQTWLQSCNPKERPGLRVRCYRSMLQRIPPGG